MLVFNNRPASPRAVFEIRVKHVVNQADIVALLRERDAKVPALRGLHSSTFQLNVSTFRGIRWVIWVVYMTMNVSGLGEKWMSVSPCLPSKNGRGKPAR